VACDNHRLLHHRQYQQHGRRRDQGALGQPAQRDQCKPDQRVKREDVALPDEGQVDEPDGQQHQQAAAEAPQPLVVVARG